MSEKTVWRSASMEGKWKDGKGDVRLAIVDFYGKIWLDWREGASHKTRMQTYT